MSRDSRAQWRVKEAELNKLCDEADARGEGGPRLEHEHWVRFCAHYDNRSWGDRIGGIVDRFFR
jgi:hypothetical protein